MKKNLSCVFNIVKYNFKTLIRFELLFKIALGVILIPLVILFCNLTMKLTGYTYLTLENIGKFFLNPITLLFLIFIIIYLTVLTMFEISTLVIIYDMSYHKKQIGVMDSIKLAFHKCKILFKLENLGVTFLVLFLIPFLNIGFSSNVITSIKIPEFLMDFIKGNTILLVLFIIVYLILFFLLSAWLYSLHYMVLEEKSFKQAIKASRTLIKKSMIKDQIKIFLIQLLIALSFFLTVIVGIGIIMIFNKIFGDALTLKSIVMTIIWFFIGTLLIIYLIISNGLNYAVISSLFYQHKLDKKEKISTLKIEKLKKSNSKAPKIIIIIISILAIIGGFILTYEIVSGKINMNIEYVRNMEITAHRGASILYPENTMAAFRGAKELGADWIELDVQQTKDKQIVVSHDTNVYRVTGLNKDIIDMTYEEISKLDAGSFKDKKFKGEKMPLLSEVLEFANKNNIKLNIELKPTGKETDFEKQVVELINQYDMKEKCVVTSQVYEVLENTKKVDSDIKTVYVMSIAIGVITDLQSVDAYSIEASNATTNQVRRVHNTGKQLYAWTVNTEESINQMIDKNVDNIITDNIELGKKLVAESKQSTLIKEIIKKIQ